MLADLLVEYCSPTLAGIKTANLFNFSYGSHSHAEMALILALWNRRLNSKGVSLKALRISKENALLYVYREKKLKEDFSKNGVAEFLSSCGYDVTDIQSCIERLSKRICKSKSFPHEIGLFLGYPLGDVTGFIENKGKNSLYTGFWKIYCNKNETLKIFEKYKKCRKVYQKLYNGGKPLMQLTATTVAK